MKSPLRQLRPLRLGLAVLLMAALALPAAAVQGALPADEEFRYRWHLSNFVGSIAGLFFPNEGEGELSFKTQDNGQLRSELLITSKESRDGEYWRYGSLIDARRLQPIRAWSSYLWRGESKSRSSEIEEQGIMDMVSGIYSIRRDPPSKPRPMEIWSDGRVYPVVVVPLGLERRNLPGNKSVAARHFSIRADNSRAAQRGDRERKKWKGKIDLWLTPDAAAVPIEIHISRNLADVRLQLLPGQI
jgi:hypothetical protein